MIRRVIILALVVAGGWWYWTRWRPAHDLKKFSGRLQNTVNKELAAAGITDKDVVRQLSRERSGLGLSWVESARTFRTPPARWESLLDRLSAAGKAVGCTVRRREASSTKALLELSKGPFLIQRLEFVPPVEGKTARTPEVALVIDDVAYDLTPMDRFAALGVPLTFAILPHDKNSKGLADKATRLNFPVILHLPMEPLDLAHNNPGGAGLYLKMTPEQLHRQFEKNVSDVPHIQGINNHMGSAFTEDLAKMALVMKWVKEKGFFFLDSRTSTRSVVAKAAKQAGVPCLVNETFLDNEDDSAAIEKQLDLVLKLALTRKRTIAIGHYRRKHLVEALANKIPEFQASGVSFVGLPALYIQS